MTSLLLAAAAGGQEAPTITYFTPTGGPQGTAVMLAGDHFDLDTPANNQVQINGQTVDTLIVEEGRLSFRVPAGATTGFVTVTTSGGTATSALPFKVGPVTMTLEPMKAFAFAESVVTFTAAVIGGAPEVRWRVNDIEGGNAGVGTIAQTNPAAYTAPAAVPSPSKVLVSAVSVADPDVRAVAPVDIASPNDGVPDLTVGYFDPDTFSTDPDLGLGVSRIRILVQMSQAKASLASIMPVLGEINGRVVGGFSDVGLMIVEIPDSGDVAAAKAAAEALKAASGVETAAPDLLIGQNAMEPRPPKDAAHAVGFYVGTTRNVKQAADMWSWEVSPSGKNWGQEYCNFPQAWNFRRFIDRNPNRRINVGVLDVGNVQDDHQDLDGMVVNLTAGDVSDHSTHVAGIISTNWLDNLGITGVTPYAHIISQRDYTTPQAAAKPVWYSSLGQTYVDNFRQIVRHAGNLRVINMSMGFNWFPNGFGFWNDSTTAGTPGFIDWPAEWARRWNWQSIDSLPLGTPGGRQQWTLVDGYGTAQNEPVLANKVADYGRIALNIARWCADGGRGPNLVFVTSAGNDRSNVTAEIAKHNPAGGIARWRDGTVGTPAADRMAQWWAENFRAEYSKPMGWAAYNGANNILVVEALTEQSDRKRVRRVDFCNRAVVKGDSMEPIPYGFSAPGEEITSTYAVPNNAIVTDGYVAMGGTSMAAPHVAGLVAYLFAIAPELTVAQAIEALQLSGRKETGPNPLGGTMPLAAPAIDAFNAVLKIDEVKGRPATKTKFMKRVLLNIDDGTVDGCDRSVVADEHGSVPAGTAYADLVSEDIVINMSDFRRFRDAYLQIAGRDGALDNPTSEKRDLNESGLPVGTRGEEDVYPRCDFDGDGKIHVFFDPKKPDAPNDLKVMADLEIWNDPDVTAEDDAMLLKKLEYLIRSGDIKIDPGDAFKKGATLLQVKAWYTGTERYIFNVKPEDVVDAATGKDNRRVITIRAMRKFKMFARAYDGGMNCMGSMRPESGPTPDPLREGEDRTFKFVPIEPLAKPENFMVEPGTPIALGLSFGEAGKGDNPDLLILPDEYEVTWKMPSMGEVTTGPNGWSYVADTGAGEVKLEAEIRFDGEVLNPPENPYAVSDGILATGKVKSPAGLAVDSAGNTYVSDSEQGAVIMNPPGKKGFALLRDLNKPGDVELDPKGHALVVAEANGKVSVTVFGISGRVKDPDGYSLIGATVTAQTTITGTPGSGDTISRCRTDVDGWFHVFWLLKPPLGETTADCVVTVEYKGKAQAYEVTVGPQGQKLQDLVFGVVELTTNVVGEGVVNLLPGIYSYIRGQSVTLSAAPALGWKFEGWAGDLDSTDNPISFPIMTDTKATAVFSQE